MAATNSCKTAIRSMRNLDGFEMKAWIDEYGDVVWHDGTAKINWTGYLDDGCRILVHAQDYYECEQCIGTWMILK